MKKTDLFVGNWKMHGDLAQLSEFMHSLAEVHLNSDCEIVICPPSPLFAEFNNLCADSVFILGGQDCHFVDKGAYTGDISPKLLSDFNCKYVIIGHSERRMYHHEHDEIVAKKVKAAVANDLVPILCVGETFNERESQQYRRVIAEQISKGLALLSGGEELVIAYEPVWAIGTGKIPSALDVAEVCDIITETIELIGFGSVQEGIRVLYGGSVNDENVFELNQVDLLSGYLIGSASLDPSKFTNIINSKIS